jgi:hypothetical protein
MSRSYKSWKMISGRVMGIYMERSRNSGVPSGAGRARGRAERGSTWRLTATYSNMRELLDSYRSVLFSSVRVPEA